MAKAAAGASELSRTTPSVGVAEIESIVGRGETNPDCVDDEKDDDDDDGRNCPPRGCPRRDASRRADGRIATTTKSRRRRRQSRETTTTRKKPLLSSSPSENIVSPILSVVVVPLLVAMMMIAAAVSSATKRANTSSRSLSYFCHAFQPIYRRNDGGKSAPIASTRARDNPRPQTRDLSVTIRPWTSSPFSFSHRDGLFLSHRAISPSQTTTARTTTALTAQGNGRKTWGSDNNNNKKSINTGGSSPNNNKRDFSSSNRGSNSGGGGNDHDDDDDDNWTVPEYVKIPEDRIDMSFVRSSGAGGQNVNKVNTQVQIRVHVPTASWIPWEVRQRILERHGNRVNGGGFLTVSSQEYRTQAANRRDAVEKLRRIVSECWPRPKQRKMRRGLSKKTKQKRKEQKRHRGQIKRNRKPVSLD